jgi:hypothetical protein
MGTPELMVDGWMAIIKSLVLDEPKREVRPKYLFTLIHGTFARGAAWTKEDSLLCQELKRTLKEEIGFPPFKWTGDNSHSAREIAAQELVLHIEKVAQLHPDADHYLICHSHGGNVALRALGKDNTERHVKGVLTLGTPFITCHPRAINFALRVLGWALPFSFFLVLLFMSAAIVVLASDWGFSHGHRSAVLAAIFIYMLTMGPILLWRSIRVRKWTKSRLRPWIICKQSLALKKLQNPELKNVELLSLYVKHDEAGTWLKVLEFVGDLAHRLYKLNGFLVASIGVGLIAALILLSTVEKYYLLSDLVFSDLALPFIYVALLYVVSSPMLGLFPWVIRGHKFGFGGETLFDNMLLRISTERRPTWVARAATVEVRPNVKTGLRHSAFYNDPNVIGLAAAWIKNRRIEEEKVARHRWVSFFAAVAASTGPYVAVAILLLGFVLFRWPQYESAYHLVSDPVDWELRYPELVSHLVSMKPVLSAKNYETEKKSISFYTGKGKYCALVGYIRSANSERFSVGILQQDVMPLAYTTPDAMYISLHIPLAEEATYSFRFYSDITRPFANAAVVDADVSVACWDKAPNEIPKPYPKHY